MWFDVVAVDIAFVHFFFYLEEECLIFIVIFGCCGKFIYCIVTAVLERIAFYVLGIVICKLLRIVQVVLQESGRREDGGKFFSNLWHSLLKCLAEGSACFEIRHSRKLPCEYEAGSGSSRSTPQDSTKGRIAATRSALHDDRVAAVDGRLLGAVY